MDVAFEDGSQFRFL